MDDNDRLLAEYEHELADEPPLPMLVGEMRSLRNGDEVDAITNALLRIWRNLDD